MHACMSCRDGVIQSSFIHEDTGTLQYNLANSNGLVRGLQYSLTLVARNSIGLSNESAPVYYTSLVQPTLHDDDEANITVILVSVLASVLLLLLSIGLLVIFLVIRRKRRRAKSSISKQREQES